MLIEWSLHNAMYYVSEFMAFFTGEFFYNESWKKYWEDKKVQAKDVDFENSKDWFTNAIETF